MVAMNFGSFMDLGFSFDRIVLGIVVGVLLLAVYEAAVLITAILATRSGRRPAQAPRPGIPRASGR
jgi:hypothetical protein